jgi:spore coat protein U-like protein
MRLRELAKWTAGAAIAAMLPTAPAFAQSATASTTFQVTTNIDSDCAIEATDMNFGDYHPVGPSIAGSSSILLVCTTSTAWNVGLDQGLFPGATVTTRQMTGALGSSLAYSLFSDSARTINWGNTVGSDTVSGTGTGGPQVVTVYGRIPSGQSVAGIGGYQDTITATVTF